MERLKNDLKRYGWGGIALLLCLTLVSIVLLARSVAEVLWSPYQALLVWVALTLVIAITTARHPINLLGTGTGVSVSEALTFLAVIVLGPFHGALLAAVDTLLASRRFKIRPTSYLFNIASISISVFAAGKTYYAVASWLSANPMANGAGESLVEFGIPLVCLAFANYVLQLSMISTLSKLGDIGKIGDRLRDTWPWEPVSYLACAVIAGVINYACRQGIITAAVTLALALPVLIVIYYTFKTYHDKLGEQENHYREFTSIYDSILEMLAMAIDAKDDVTHDHLQRVKLFARRMGEIIGLSQLEIEALNAGSLLHDIGKIGVPAYILNKPGKLTEHEFEQMKMHTIIGADMLSNVDFRYPVVPIVRHHHERWDGRGYPDGLAGEEIPITARILTLVDNYDALRSDRPYKKGMSQDAALTYIKQNAGIYFDPMLVETFLSLVDQLETEAAGLQYSQKKRPSHTSSLALASARPAAGFASAPKVDRARAALTSIAETNQRVTALYEMSRTLSSILSVEDTIAILANRISKLVPFTTCAISLFDPSRSEFEIAYAVGRHAEKLMRRRLPAEAGITGWVITNQRAMYNTNPVLDLGFLGASPANEYKGVMVFPLVKNREPLGAIALYSTEIESYGSEHIQLMESASQPASDAVYNALMFEQAQRNALTDPASGLPNTRALTMQFERERARSQRLGTPLSLITISIDNLEEAALTVNTSSDQMLASVGKLIALQVRETDLLVRHSSNALLAMLPDTGHVDAADARNRIRQAIEQFSNGSNVRVSLGQATSPDEGSSFEELIQAAQMECIADRHRMTGFSLVAFSDEIAVRSM